MAIRRISRVRETQASEGAQAEMKETLRSIAKMQETIAQLNANIAPLMEKLEASMIKMSVLSVSAGNAIAEFTQSAGKTQNIIDPAKFFKKVTEEDFFACCSISVTKAKDLMGKKELERISDSIPGVTGEKKLKISIKK